MLIEQIIEFELKGAWAPCCTYILKTGYFHDKTTIFKGKSSSALFHAKNVAESKYLNFLDLGQVTKLNPKMQDFRRVLDFT